MQRPECSLSGSLRQHCTGELHIMTTCPIMAEADGHLPDVVSKGQMFPHFKQLLIMVSHMYTTSLLTCIPVLSVSDPITNHVRISTTSLLDFVTPFDC